MRLHRLDLNLLVVLDTMLVEQSVSQTAQRLNMTQPAISNALSRARAHFGDELFVVMGRRMLPTPFCESLAGPIREVINDLRLIATARAAFDPETAIRTFTVICSDYVFLVFLSKAIRQLAKVAPGVGIRTMLTDPSRADLLRSGRADFGIFPQPRRVEGLPHVALFEDEFSVIAWTENSKIGKELTKKQYLSLQHVSTSIGTITPSHIEHESLKRSQVVRDITVYAPDFTSVAEVVVGTDYIATVHSRSAAILSQRLPLRVFRPPVEIVAFAEHLQWNPVRETDPGTRWMKDFFVNFARDHIDALA